MERKCRHVRRVKQYRYKREYRRRGGKVINVERRKISRAVISRLPRYYRYLGDLLEIGVERISSNDLSKKMNVTASQIRQDLNNFGGFGQQGYGYNVKYLYTEIGKILGLDKTHNFIIIGAGNLGQALANYAAFERSGFILKSLFDVNPRLEGVAIRGIPVRMMDELVDFLKENEIEIENINQYTDDEDSLNLKFCFHNIKNGKYQIKQYYVNRKNGSVQDLWRQLGYSRELENSEIDYLKSVSMPGMKMETVQVKNGILTLENIIMPQEIRMIEILYRYSYPE